MVSVLWSGNAIQRESAKSRRERGQWKKSVSIAGNPPTVERMQSIRQELQSGKSGCLVLHSHPAAYECSLFPGGLAVSTVFKRNSGVLPAFLDEIFKSRKSFLIVCRRSTFIPMEHRADFFSTFKEPECF